MNQRLLAVATKLKRKRPCNVIYLILQRILSNMYIQDIWLAFNL
jgi:hypothetical protein